MRAKGPKANGEKTSQGGNSGGGGSSHNQSFSWQD
jgi:hypothetical protein